MRIIPIADSAAGPIRGQIHMLGVDPDLRGKGIGQRVLSAGLSYLRRRGVDTVELTVDASNRPARLLYETFGFEVRSASRLYEKVLN